MWCVVLKQSLSTPLSFKARFSSKFPHNQVRLVEPPPSISRLRIRFLSPWISPSADPTGSVSYYYHFTSSSEDFTYQIVKDQCSTILPDCLLSSRPSFLFSVLFQVCLLVLFFVRTHLISLLTLVKTTFFFLQSCFKFAYWFLVS